MNIIKSLIKRAILKLSVKDDTGYNQVSQVESLGNTSNAEIINSYGMSSNPPKDSNAIIMNVQGNEENKIAFVQSSGNRFKGLKESEVKIGNYIKGSYIYFNENNEILFSNGLGNVIINNNGSININGVTITLDGDIVTASGISLNNHIHTGDSGGTTSPPL